MIQPPPMMRAPGAFTAKPTTPGSHVLKLDRVTKPKRGRKKKKQQPELSDANAKYPLQKCPGPVPPEAAARLAEIYPTCCLKKYITLTLDPNRPYLTVNQYSIRDNMVLWDYETGYVHLTGIWKALLAALITDHVTIALPALSYSLKADIVKLLELTPKRYQPYIKRVRGGLLRIQGTWMPYLLCKILCRRFCHPIRYELIPIFGSDFPDSCLKPTDCGFGEMKLDDITGDDDLEVPTPTPPAATSDTTHTHHNTPATRLPPRAQPAAFVSPPLLATARFPYGALLPSTAPSTSATTLPALVPSVLPVPAASCPISLPPPNYTHHQLKPVMLPPRNYGYHPLPQPLAPVEPAPLPQPSRAPPQSAAYHSDDDMAVALTLKLLGRPPSTRISITDLLV